MADPLIPIQSLDPTKVKAIITTKWSGTVYKSATIRRVEAYSISSQLDSDADPWSLDVGNPSADLNPVLARDNEVRVQVFGASTKGAVPLLTGIMDDATFTEQGTLQMTGRDMSSIPVDSDHFPTVYRNLTPTRIIQSEAEKLKCATRFQITPINGGPIKQETDGSEKFWEFWYRMVRKDGFYIWMLADGTLVVSKLHYDYAPVYSFASAKVAKKNDILVENFQWHKTTQTRFNRLGMVWRTQGTVSLGNKPSITQLHDPSTNDWVKRPDKIVEDKHVTNYKNAIKYGQEEIYESKVGAIEIMLTCQDPGFLIESDKTAHVNLPEYGIKGNWYVVGSTIKGDTNGFMQEVRLRERHFAITARVPDDPVWKPDTPTTPPFDMPSGAAAAKLFQHLKHEDWWPCFVDAASTWHGNYEWTLYLAYLLAICDHETGFTNERSDDMALSPGGGGQQSAPGQHGRVWEDIRKTNPTPTAYRQFVVDFCNTGGDGHSVIPGGYACAVGPMQLFDKGIKEEADNGGPGGSGPVDELFGGRWNPCDNIHAGAHLLLEKSPSASGAEVDLLTGICKYGGQNPDAQGRCGYSTNIYNRVHVDPNWLQIVQDALASAQAPGSGPTPAGTYVQPFSDSEVTYAGTDDGVDYCPVHFGVEWKAIGAGQICRIIGGPTPTSHWPPWVSYQLTDKAGDHYGEVIYIAENITVRADLKEGSQVSAGDTICMLSGCIETGFARDTKSDASCAGDYSGNPTGPGRAYARWMRELGSSITADPGPGGSHSTCVPKV
jgi:prophage tail gpP-like protein